MKLYPIYSTSEATKFYLVADGVEELERSDGDLKDSPSRDRIAWQDRTHRFAHAMRKLLGLFDDGDNNTPRFVRANYESDGIWCCKLFGIANERLLARYSWLSMPERNWERLAADLIKEMLP